MTEITVAPTSESSVEVAAKVQGMIQKLLDAGATPAVVRRRLQAYGIQWRYEDPRHAGLRERIRNLKRLGLGLCSTCRRQPYRLGGSVNVCPSCLEAKWTSGQ